jgi:hypothetical protein
MHYELRLYPVDAVSGASRRATSAGTEMESTLDSPARVLTFDSLPSLAVAAFADHGNLVGLSYAVDDDGTARPVSTGDLAQAVDPGAR